MKTIKTIVNKYLRKGYDIPHSQSAACQEILLNKIASSNMADKVLLKGGVVIFNMTQNLRRATIDLDFDFIRYDISNESIKLFADLLNRSDEYKVSIIRIEDLHQEDYQGKRVWTTVSDKTYSIHFKLDIGVHTLLSIEQSSACFYFDNDNGLILKVNPPEQIFAEKLYSLAKHGAKSTRFKDINDLYFFIKNNMLNKDMVKKCIDLLLLCKTQIKSLNDICDIVSETFKNDDYIENFIDAKDKWLDVDYKDIFESILDFIYSI